MLVLTIAAEAYSPGVTDEMSACASITIPQSALLQVHNLFQNEFSKHFDLVLPSTSSIFSLPYGHLLAACAFFVFPSHSFIFLRI